MANAFKRIVYISQQNLDIGFDQGAAILNILSLSVRNNTADGITGALLCSQGHFAQLIEGPSAAINGLVIRLKRDPRHLNMQIIEDRAIEQRVFAEWSMALVDDEGHIAMILTDSAKIVHAGKTALAFLRYIVNERAVLTYAMDDNERASRTA